jgi:signal transduction histidine kinase/DNA-binding NarL/FixJ family response regulator
MMEVTNKTRLQLVGSYFKDYFTEPPKASKVYQEVFEKGFVVNTPLTIKGHTLTDVLFNGSVYKNELGEVVGAVVVARDITAQKEIEKELTEAKIFAEMATIIAEESKIKAETATLTAENAVKAKQQFLSNMSHEIRTPMNSIIGFTKAVMKTDLTWKQKEYLSAIKTSGDSLIVLINDILDLAKVDSGKMTFEQKPFKLEASITTMLHLFEAKAQEKNIVLSREYDGSIPKVLLGDQVRLHQIMLNLVSNALKFTTTGTITVGVSLLKDNKDRATIEFSITDTGIGIPEDKMETIFENFQQASSETSRLFGGTGLGLAISKQLVEQQGGSIRVKSEMGKGSTFSFILDFKKTIAAAELDAILTELDTNIKNIKVLVVEDMALNQLLMKTILDDFGFDRDIADNGRIAIEKLKAKSFDVILMDLQMPEMNGFEATEYIRNTLHSKIPIIALTADVTTVDFEKCKAAGMDDYLAKPIDERLLYSKIVGLVMKPLINHEYVVKETDLTQKMKYTDLDYLTQRTKNNAAMMMEMISAYLEQTPPLISTMKRSLEDKDWDSLHAAVHKMIPSFTIMGMSTDFENMAKKVLDFARTQQQTEGITELVLQLESACTQACKELEAEIHRFKSANS